MLAKTSAGGLCTAFPDVCLTPAPPSPSPVPVPYPNVGAEPTDTGFVPNVLITAAPAHTMATQPVMSNGDNPGVATGVASGTVMGPVRTVTAAFTVLVGGMPLARLTSATIQNNTNAPGAKLVPSATNVLVMSP
ncbi:MAG: DUF4150 domain-containing protein [Deltaproteobacteria bacterium]|jgi:hypothetical protein|nr:DUF4150 domain-containing protein [Deltaproteobacteria bacterium]MBW2535828.1 DUF4150 domain-containing protein [Deltaproteobacteria bacterium]